MNIWPPQCCVAALLNAALRASGASIDNPMLLPGLLGTRVGPNDANPLKLAVTTDADACGVPLPKAMEKIPALLARFSSPFSFRHVPLNTIAFGQYDDVLRDALRSGCVVGTGVDCSLLPRRRTDERALHVFRVLSVHPQARVTLFDDSGEYQPPSFDVPTDVLMSAVRKTPDGFWIFGPPEALSLDGTLPWDRSV